MNRKRARAETRWRRPLWNSAGRSRKARCRGRVSASTRNRGPRASSRLYGSRSYNSGVTVDDCRYVAEVTISRCSFFRLQPWSMKFTASQSSKFGMRRRLGLRAEILACGYDADSEVGLPDAIHDGARRGGRVAVCQPLGKRQPGGLPVPPDASWGSGCRNAGTPGVTSLPASGNRRVSGCASRAARSRS